ncbi:MAG: Radical, partial [Myxococcaceae bacterium]|nr:Radical [Myxococcaceae bacterium]
MLTQWHDPSPRSRRVEEALAQPAEQLATLRRLPLAHDFDAALRGAGLFPLKPTRLEIFQINDGKVCNQTCRHCHVDTGPDRRESMTRETMELCIAALAKTSIPTVDITGGAPEMNPHFRWLVEQCTSLSARCTTLGSRTSDSP